MANVSITGIVKSVPKIKTTDSGFDIMTVLTTYAINTNREGKKSDANVFVEMFGKMGAEFAETLVAGDVIEVSGIITDGLFRGSEPEWQPIIKAQEINRIGTMNEFPPNSSLMSTSATASGLVDRVYSNDNFTSIKIRCYTRETKSFPNSIEVVFRHDERMSPQDIVEGDLVRVVGEFNINKYKSKRDDKWRNTAQIIPKSFVKYARSGMTGPSAGHHVNDDDMPF